MISPEEPLTIQQQCQLLSLSHSGYYYMSARESDLNLQLLRRIDELHTDSPTWGSRMQRDRLKLEGFEVNRKRIRRLMAILRIKVIYPGKNLTSTSEAGRTLREKGKPR
ncbi:MAG: transposase [Candidatus Altiarchaeota archaeon]|nr:transposase [Candidatus Altiarchaeota archaeon]